MINHNIKLKGWVMLVLHCVPMSHCPLISSLARSKFSDLDRIAVDKSRPLLLQGGTNEIKQTIEQWGLFLNDTMIPTL